MIRVMKALMKSYTELCTLPTYEERLEYLQLHGEVGRDTFGFDRWLNQDFYQSREWRQFRDRIIARDMGCDLGCKDHPITDWVLRDGRPIRPKISIHHINPITKDDVLQHSEKLLDPENAICASAATHKVIHYGTGEGPEAAGRRKKTGRHLPVEEMSMYQKKHLTGESRTMPWGCGGSWKRQRRCSSTLHRAAREAWR